MNVYFFFEKTIMKVAYAEAISAISRIPGRYDSFERLMAQIAYHNICILEGKSTDAQELVDRFMRLIYLYDSHNKVNNMAYDVIDENVHLAKRITKKEMGGKLWNDIHVELNALFSSVGKNQSAWKHIVNNWAQYHSALVQVASHVEGLRSRGYTIKENESYYMLAANALNWGKHVGATMDMYIGQ